jgi:hypothetical protein
MVNACARLIAAHPAKGVEVDETAASLAVGTLINAHGRRDSAGGEGVTL